MSLGTNAYGEGYETRVTLLDADPTIDWSIYPVPVYTKLAIGNHEDNKYYGNFLTAENKAQGIYCGEDCELRHWALNGSDVAGDTYTAMVEILPILNPCDGCTISCTDSFSSAVAGCTANPGGSNCVTVTIDPVTTDLSSTCTAGNGANKIRIDLVDHFKIVCLKNCKEPYLVDGNYLLGAQTPGQAYDRWLSTNSTVTFDFTNDPPTSFTLEIMAVDDIYPATVP